MKSKQFIKFDLSHVLIDFRLGNLLRVYFIAIDCTFGAKAVIIKLPSGKR